MKFSTKTKSILYGIEFTHGARRALMFALGLLYFLSFGFSVVSVTTLFAISTIIMMFFEFPTGAIADYDSRKKSIMIGFFLMAVAFFGLFVFRNFWLLGGSWILGDIAWTFCSGAQGAWATDALGFAKNKSKLVALIAREYMFEKSGHIIGGIIGLIIVAINFRFIWLFVSVSQLFMFFIIMLYMEERNFKPEKVPHSYLKKSLIKAKESFNYLIHRHNRELRVLMIAGFLGIFSISVFFVGVPLLFTQVLGLNPEHLSGLHSVFAIIALAGPLVAERLSHKKGGFRVPLFTFFLIMSISIIIFALSRSLILAIIVYAIQYGIEAGSDVLEDSAKQHEFDSKIRASLGSLDNIIWSLGYSSAVFLAGLSITFIGLIQTIIASGILTFITSLIFLWGMKK